MSDQYVVMQPNAPGFKGMDRFVCPKNVGGQQIVTPHYHGWCSSLQLATTFGQTDAEQFAAQVPDEAGYGPAMARQLRVIPARVELV